MHVVVRPPENRVPVLYARLKPVNHAWMHDEAKRNGFDSVSEFTDALIESLRTGQAVTMEASTTKSNMMTKKVTKRARSIKK